MEPLSPLHHLPHTPLSCSPNLYPHPFPLPFPSPLFPKTPDHSLKPPYNPETLFLFLFPILVENIRRIFYRCLQLSGAADVHHVDCGFWTLALSPRDGRRRAAPPPPPPPPRLVYPITIFFSSFPIKDSSVNLGPNRPNHHHRLPTNQSIGREKEISNR